MKLIDAQKTLSKLKQPIIQTSDAAICLKISRAHASKILERLEKSGQVKKIMRGLWMIENINDPLILPQYITAPYPSYISLQTALYYHGLISQIPATTYAVSLDRTKQYNTVLGKISIHHVQSELFFDYYTLRNSSIKIATPEKALLDFLYFSTTRSYLFKKLPEIEIPKNFKISKVKKMIKKIPSKILQNIVQKSFNEILEYL